MDIMEESKISLFLSVKLLMAPFEVCIWRHDFRRSFQLTSGIGYPSLPSWVLGSLIKRRVPCFLIEGSFTR